MVDTVITLADAYGDARRTMREARDVLDAALENVAKAQTLVFRTENHERSAHAALIAEIEKRGQF